MPKPLKIGGSGSPDDPFQARVEFIIETLIDDPMATHIDIRHLAADNDIDGLSAIAEATLRQGVLRRLVRRRIDPVNRLNKSPGTSFVKVRLYDRSDDMRAEFEERIIHIDGVIEWDCVSSREYDYLVRVAGAFATERSMEISDRIGEIDIVTKVDFGGVQILKSGVVDNFNARDFFEFSDK